jgi:hypothetical protein
MNRSTGYSTRAFFLWGGSGQPRLIGPIIIAEAEAHEVAPLAAADLAEAATQIAERLDVRPVLIAGNRPNFTIGGTLACSRERRASNCRTGCAA